MTILLPVKATPDSGGGVTLGQFAPGDVIDSSVMPPLSFVANVQSGTSYTLVASDAGKEIQMTNAAANTVVVPMGVLAANQVVRVRQVGTGATSISGASGMDVKRAGTSLTAAQQGATIDIRIDSSSTAYAGGGVIGGGSPGEAATIAPGAVTKLAPGSAPTVVNTGTSSAAVFAFGLVTGDPGAAGAAGAAGADGADGPPSTTIAANVQSGTSYTMTADDAGVEIQMTSASPNTVYVPANTVPPNSVSLIRQVGAGATKVAGNGAMAVVAAGPSLQAAQQGSLMYVRVDSGTLSYVGGEVSTVGSTPAITLDTSFPAPVVGTAYTGYVHGTNAGGATGTLVYSVNSLPAGMSLSSSTGAITGTPTTAQTVGSTFSVTNGTQTVTATNSFVVTAALVPSITVTLSLPAPTLGQPYTGSLTAVNVQGASGAITFTETTLPAGLSSGTVVSNGGGSYTQPITGTPTTSGSTTTTFTVTNGTQTVSPTNTFVVASTVTVPSVVQRATAATEPSQAITLTLSNTPIVGNYLLVLIANVQRTPNAMVPATGVWTAWSYGNFSSGTTLNTNVFVHEVVTGDGTTFTFPVGSTNQYQTGEIFEITNTNGVITAAATFAAVSNSITSETLTASVEAGNALPFAWLVASTNTAPTATTSTAGWTAEDNVTSAGNCALSTFVGPPSSNSVATAITITKGDNTNRMSLSGLLLMGPK